MSKIVVFVLLLLWITAPVSAQGPEPSASSETNPVAAWIESKMPDSLTQGGFLLKHWQWLGLLSLVFLGVVLDKVVTLALELTAIRWFRKTLPDTDPQLVHGAVRPIGLIAMAVVWWVGILWLGLQGRIERFLTVAVQFVTAAAVVWSAYRMVDILAAGLARRAATTDNRFDDLLVPLIRKSGKIFIAAFGVVFVADNLEINITSLVAGLGLGGLALAMASKDTVENLFGSLTVLVDRPFQVGDWVVVNDVEGTVEEVGFRSTRVRTFYNSQITLPNATLISASVDNMGARTYRRWSTTLSITYDTPPEKVEAFCEAVRELVRRHPYTRKDYYQVYLNSFAAASLDILLYVFFKTPDWNTELRERHRLAVDILRVAARLGVEFAFPTQTLYLKRPTTDGEAAARAAMAYGGVVDEVVSEGRQEARSLVETVLKGAVPPPVQIVEEEEKKN